MYHVSAQGVDERMINVHYYYYYYDLGTLNVLHLQTVNTENETANNYMKYPFWHLSIRRTHTHTHTHTLQLFSVIIVEAACYKYKCTTKTDGTVP